MKPFLLLLFSIVSTIVLAQGIETASYSRIDQYSAINSEYKTLHCDCQNGHYIGVASKNDSILVDCYFKKLERFNKHLIIATGEDWKVGIVDFHGDTVLPIIYDRINLYDYPKVATLKTDHYLLNDEGQLHCTEAFGSIRTYSNYLRRPDLILYRQNGLYGYMNWELDIVIPPSYKKARDFYLNRSAVLIGGHYGFINTNQDTVIEPRFTDALDFSSDAKLAMVANEDSLWGFVDRDGEIKIDFQYDEPSKYNEYGFINHHWRGYAVVNKNGKKGMIDESGKEFLPIKYSKFEEIRFVGHNGSNLLVFDGDKSGIIDWSGNIRVPIECQGELADTDRFVKWIGKTNTHTYKLFSNGNLIVEEI